MPANTSALFYCGSSTLHLCRKSAYTFVEVTNMAGYCAFCWRLRESAAQPPLETITPKSPVIPVA